MPSNLPFKLVSGKQPASLKKVCDVGICTQSDEAADEVADLLDALCAITRMGCFSATTAGGTGATILPGSEIKNGRWNGEVELRGIHPAFWRILLQICAQYHRLVSPISLIEVGMALEDPLAVPYPRPIQSAPFAMQRHPVQNGTPAVIRLDADSWPSDAFASAKQAFEDWGSVVYAGGYFPVDCEMDEAPFDFLQVNLVGLTRLECVAMEWRSADEALDEAMMLCIGISQSVRRLSRVELE